jgi:magnesium transporter
MEPQQKTPWNEISALLQEKRPAADIEAALDRLDPDELLHTVYSLKPDDQRALLAVLSPARAAELVEDLPDAHVADLIEEMPVADAAPIVVELASDHRADVLAELDADDAEAIIARLDEEDAEEVRELIAYPPDVAGGLMMTEFASYPMSMTVREAVDDLTSGERDYSLLTVHYIYVVVRRRRLKGVIRIRDLVFSDPAARIGDLSSTIATCSSASSGAAPCSKPSRRSPRPTASRLPASSAATNSAACPSCSVRRGACRGSASTYC